MCLRGSSEVQTSVLATIKDPNLAAYVVWVPELGATSSNVPGAMALVSDPRAHHYWDGHEQLGNAYEHTLPTPGPSWDVYLLFERQQRWRTTEPPNPVSWMHQLGGVTSAPRLNAGVFREQVAHLLANGGS